MRTHRAGSPVTRVDGYAPIGDYAAIGDGRTIALVARDGSIDWLPLPTIDQATAFGALLDAKGGGSFRLAPEGEFGVERRYLEGTNVLETTFTTDGGVLVVTDALTLQDGGLLPWAELVRHLRCVSGSVRVRWSVQPRFGYGQEDSRFEQIGGVAVAIGKRLRLAVHAWDAGSAGHSAKEVAGVAGLTRGDEALIVCVATDDEPVPAPDREEVHTRLDGTCASWRRWLDGLEYEGPARAAVERSALALKLLTYAPSGALAAAGTTGLPEKIGGERNYDYRFCWIRDTAFTLDALSGLGYREQVHASLSWLLEAVEPTHPRLQPLYGLDGSVPRATNELPVEGYRGSRPVTRGNSAATQLQLGNYGDLFDTVWHYVRGGNVLDPLTGTRLAENATYLCEIWRNEDAGLWELDDVRNYTSSKMSCWLALTRAVALALEGQLPHDGLERWRETADEIRAYVETSCWSEQKRAYAFYAGTDDLDCGVLLGAQFGFFEGQEERLASTVDAIRAELAADGPLLYRYTGMEGEEGCFLACSFWLVSALSRLGRTDEARDLFGQLLKAGNDVGLYSEEIDPASGELLGNFPQALTHLSLIRAALSVAHESETENGGDK